MIPKIIITLTILFLLQKTHPLPLMRFLHGLGSNCILENFTFKTHFKNYSSKCIGTTMGIFTPFESQIKIACDQLNAETDLLKDGFTLIGISQGGLIARAVLQRCEIGKFVKRLITIGGTHKGVAVIPRTNPTGVFGFVVQACYYKHFMGFIGPCGYVHSLKYDEEFLKSGSSLLDLNNEIVVNEVYKERIRNLELFMAIGFGGDKVIQPSNSSVFGFFRDDKYDSYYELEESDLYKEDRLGLKVLQESGRLFRCVVPGDHLQIGSYMEPLVVQFSNYLNEDYKNVLDGVKDVCRFKENK